MAANSYHHGDLKNELIQTGVHLLAQEGYEGFSLRKLARLCDVSHAAPYKHFKNKEEIIIAISSHISAEFAGSLQNAIEQHPDNKKVQMIEMGKQYVRFMSENPDYFRFVFMVDHGRPIELNSATLDKNRPLSIAYTAIQNYFDPGHEQGALFMQKFIAFWSLLHGYTLLLVNHTVLIEGDYLETAHKMIEDFLGNQDR